MTSRQRLVTGRADCSSVQKASGRVWTEKVTAEAEEKASTTERAAREVSERTMTGGTQEPARGDSAPTQGKATESGNAEQSKSDVPSSSAGKSAKEADGGPAGSGQAKANATEDANTSQGKGEGKAAGGKSRRQRRRRAEQRASAAGGSEPSQEADRGKPPVESEWQQVKAKKQQKRSSPRSESQAPPKKASQGAPQGKNDKSKGSSKANAQKGKAPPPKGGSAPGPAPSGAKDNAKDKPSTGGIGGFKIPKKTYAETAGSNRKEQKADAKVGGDDQGEEDGKGVILYVHTSKDQTLPINEAQFSFVYEHVQKAIMSEWEATGELKYSIYYGDLIKQRGQFLCCDEASAVYIAKLVDGLTSKNPDTGETTFYRTWRKGEFGTTLVTVFVPDRERTPNPVLIDFIIKCNGLKGRLHNFISGKVSDKGVRKITFGVDAADAATLRKIQADKKLLRAGILACTFHIAKEKGQESSEQNKQGNPEPTSSHDGSKDHDTSNEAMDTSEVADDAEDKAKAYAKAKAEAVKAKAEAMAKAAEAKAEADEVMANINK